MWVDQAGLAVINAVVVLVITFVPILIFQSRRLGKLSFRRVVGSFALAAYITALFTYTWLPLPRPEDLTCHIEPRYDPLGFVTDFKLALEQGIFGAGMVTALQLVLNVLLFIPWGIFWRRFLERGILSATLTGLVISVFIELAQLTGLFGIYPCAYRTFDAADIVLNTTGALLGAVLAPAVLWWMPKTRALRASRLQPKPVTLTRRWLGMLIDLVGCTGLSFLLNFLGLIIGMLIIGAIDGRLVTFQESAELQLISFLCALVLPWLIWIVIPALGASGASPGQTAMWLEPRWGDQAGSWWQRLFRAHVVPGPALVLAVAGQWVLISPWQLVAGAVMAAAAVVCAPFTTTHRSISGLVSGCTFADTRDGVTRTPEEAG